MEQVINTVNDKQLYPSVIWFDAIIEPPTPEKIAELRKHTGLSGQATANILGLSGRQIISDYERGEKAGKPFSPNKQTWTLWLLLTGQHPTLEVLPRVGETRS